MDGKLSKGGRTWYRFQDVTLCPIDRKLIDKKLMTREQIDYLNAYHRKVYRKLARRLDREHKEWLRLATRPI